MLSCHSNSDDKALIKKQISDIVVNTMLEDVPPPGNLTKKIIIATNGNKYIHNDEFIEVKLGKKICPINDYESIKKLLKTNERVLYSLKMIPIF